MNPDIDNCKYYLIIDFEATCCDKQAIPRQEMEIIEIGAVLVESAELKIVDEFMTFIKPVRHSMLTAFCTELTSITQADVDSAPEFPEAIKLFKDWLYQYENFLFCSWGDYDRKQLQQDCQFHRVPYPVASEHMNIKELFSRSQGLKKRCGMAKALKLAGLQLSGTHHRGIDDAKNMARLMPYVLGRKLINNIEV